MEIQRGKVYEPQRITLHGPEGIGKSTLASQMPRPVFVDVEGSTADLDVARVSAPKSWQALLDLTQQFAQDQHGFGTLVIDTADWAEKMAITHLCAVHRMSALGGQDDFGRSYNLLEQEWCKWLDLLSRVAKAGMHVCLLAHSKMRQFSLPDQDGSFDRWELKMERKTSAATKEWARTVLFLNYKTYVVKEGKTKSRGTGGQRVMYTSHHPAWDAKNRAGLPEELPLAYESIASLFTPPATAPAPKPVSERPVAEVVPPSAPVALDHLEPLFELMKRDGVSTAELQLAVSKRGYFPADMPIERYDPEFVTGRLVGHWPKVVKMVEAARQEVASI